MAENREEFIRAFKAKYPDDIFDLSNTEIIDRFIEYGEGDVEELYFRLKAQERHKKNIYKQKRKNVKSVEGDFPSERTLVVKCKSTKEIVFISCYFKKLGNDLWQVNSKEIKIETNHNNLFISKGVDSQGVVKYKINYFCIKQKPVKSRIVEMTPTIVKRMT